MLPRILLSNLVVAGLMFVPGSAIGAVSPTASRHSLSSVSMPRGNANTATLSRANSFMSLSQSTNSSVLVAEIDVDALNEAAIAMEKAAVAMNAAESAKSVEQVQQHFSTALSSMEDAAGLLEKAGVPDGAKAMNRAIASVRAAVDAESDIEADKLMKDAEKALSDVITAVEKAAN
jgi:hypothetical protein